MTNILLSNITHQILSKIKFQILVNCVLIFNGKKGRRGEHSILYAISTDIARFEVLTEVTKHSRLLGCEAVYFNFLTLHTKRLPAFEGR
jgi:hypothetical protein